MAARDRGRGGDRKVKLSEGQIKVMVDAQKLSTWRIAELYGVSITTVYNGYTNQAA